MLKILFYSFLDLFLFIQQNGQLVGWIISFFMRRFCLIIYLCLFNIWYNIYNKMLIGRQEGRKGKKEEMEGKRREKGKMEGKKEEK